MISLCFLKSILGVVPEKKFGLKNHFLYSLSHLMFVARLDQGLAVDVGRRLLLEWSMTIPHEHWLLLPLSS